MLFCRVSDGLYRHRPLRTLTQPFQAFKQPANVCVELAFPDHHDVPTGGLKRCVIAPVAFRVAVELSGPERDIRGRPLPALRAIMPVPETAMDKDRVPIAREDNIRPAGKIGPMKAKPKTIAEQRSPHRELQLRVASFYLGHHRRPHAGGDVVGHGRRSSPYLSAAESGRGDDRDATEGIERQQIGISGNDGIRAAADREFEGLVVVGSRHAATRSVIATYSAAVSPFPGWVDCCKPPRCATTALKGNKAGQGCGSLPCKAAAL